jgi:hydroxypyruvate reductase
VDLREYTRRRVVAIGKATHAMVEGLARVLGPDFSFEGVASAPVSCSRPVAGMKYFVAGHPIPTEASIAAAQAILELLAGCDERTVVFFLLSGGGSSLAELPLEPGITLEDVRALNRVLVTCGAPIEEINAVRKHLSAVKGGRLAAATPRAMKLTYGVTDVPEGRESALASGPTLPDPTTIADVQRVIGQYHLRETLPTSVRTLSDSNRLSETPKPGDAAFERAVFTLLLGKSDLFHQAHHAAEALGFATQCDNTTDDWPLAKAADFLLSQLEELRRRHAGKPVALIANGEVSSPVTGDGIGGRNAAFVLDCATKIAGKRVAVLSAGTDGVDGNSSAAGAVADGETLERARAAGLDPGDFFRRSDSNTFFAKLGDAVVTGPTGNNLRDLRILLAG